MVSWLMETFVSDDPHSNACLPTLLLKASLRLLSEGMCKTYGDV